MNSRRLYLVQLVMPLIPATRCFALKRAMLRWCGAKIARNVRIVSSARFYVGGDLTIGEGTWIGHEVLIVGGNATVLIGAQCDIAPRVTIATGSHEVCLDGEKIAGDGYSAAVKVGDGCWICTASTILGGSELGCCCIVAAGAVVKGSFPSRKLVGGVPAVTLRDLTKSAVTMAPKA